jgi:hypothetical protein
LKYEKSTTNISFNQGQIYQKNIGLLWYIILENFENIIELQDTERNFNDGDDNSVSQHNEWQEPTHEDIRHRRNKKCY